METASHAHGIQHKAPQLTNVDITHIQLITGVNTLQYYLIHHQLTS